MKATRPGCAVNIRNNDYTAFGILVWWDILSLICFVMIVLFSPIYLVCNKLGLNETLCGLAADPPTWKRAVS